MAKNFSSPPSVPWSVPLLLVGLCVLVYGNCLLCDFVFDDVSAIKDNRDLRPNAPFKNVFLHDFWGTPMSKEQSHKSYRPICVLTFRLNYLIHALEPMGYHLVNLALHALVCVLFHRLCLLLVGPRVSLVASLLFAVHPIHTEAVTGVVGRAELLSSIFFILAIDAYRETIQGGWGSMLKFVIHVTLATFSKEQGITVLGVCLILDVVVVHNWNLSTTRPSLRQAISQCFGKELGLRILLLLATGVTLLTIRFYVMGSTLPVFNVFDNPAAHEEAPIKQMTLSYLVAMNVWLLLSPMNLCCDWTMGTIPLIKSMGDYRNLATVVTFATLLHLGLTGLFSSHRRHRNAILIALAFMALPFLPASNLFFPVGFVVAERILYLPSMGFCLLVAHGFNHLYLACPNRGKLLNAALAFLLLAHGLKSFTRNFDWRDELTLFESGLQVNQNNAKLFCNVGHVYENEGQYEDALAYFQAAIKVQPDDLGAHINVGRTWNNLNEYQKAEEAYLLAKSLLPKAKPGQRYTTRIAPQHLSVFLNLANLVSRDPERLNEADTLYKQAISMRADFIQAYINRGDVLIKLNRTKEAQEVYEKALTYEDDNPDLYYNLGVVLIEQGKPQSALAYFDQALQHEPEHVQALMNSAILIQESGDPTLRPKAYQRLFKVLEKVPNSERVYFNLGMLAMDDERYEKAEKWFKKSIELKSDFRSALFNLALLLNEQKRPLEAIPFLKPLLSHYPGHIKGLILLGDINTNHVKDYDEAERCYNRILELEPLHIQARHNQCVVLVEKGDLMNARKCLLKVRDMVPDLDYVVRHLSIVESRLKLAEKEAETTTTLEPTDDEH
eukprot:snap_masked-scaffold193_size270907-processed-gene-1.15 protein:Tk01095 transcript:snap_masked-scaffold193_size270907-processed-gene-1.15-mRNA-1 annotation:"transmembrane and tpr repeat-containing protein cg4050-like"